MDYPDLIIKPVRHVRGGAFVPHHKNTADVQTVEMPEGKTVTIPMLQHIGVACQPTVAVGDKVFVGSEIGNSEKYISAPVHSSVSGVVKEITSIIAADGRNIDAIVIESDGKREPSPDLSPKTVKTKEDLISCAKECGLVGLGGAGFPTHVKLSPKKGTEIDTLIVNCAECEPYITSDTRTCIEDTVHTVDGIILLKEKMEFDRVIIAIEDNKQAAIDAICEELSKRKEISGIKVMPLKSSYPQGAEKVLVYTATGRKMPSGALPADVGCIVMNITSICELNRYISTGMPLVKKRLTVDGSAIESPMNVTVPIGVTFGEVIEFCKGTKSDPVKILAGGPMMGVTVSDLSQPVSKQNNAILVLTDGDDIFPETTPCINCGRCYNACPMNLMPCEVERTLKNPDTDSIAKLNVTYCIECGSCAFSCPAKRPLTQVMRLAKKTLRGSKNG